MVNAATLAEAVAMLGACDWRHKTLIGTPLFKDMLPFVATCGLRAVRLRWSVTDFKLALGCANFVTGIW